MVGGPSSLMKLAELLLLGDVAACGGAKEIWTVQGSQVRSMQPLEWMESDRGMDTGRDAQRPGWLLAALVQTQRRAARHRLVDEIDDCHASS